MAYWDSLDFKYSSASRLLQRLCQQEKENFVFSPLSLAASLAMTDVALRGDSKTEVLDFLQPDHCGKLHHAFAVLIADCQKPMEIAIKLISSNEYVIIQKAAQFLMTKYKSEIELADFRHNAREVECKVNAWVSERTKCKIPQLLAPCTLQDDTAIALLSAIYFKGSWRHEFDPLDCQQDFRLRCGEIVKRDFMRRKSCSFVYKETDRLRLVMIPYKEQPFSMVVAIPKNNEENIDEVIAETPPSEMVSILGNFREGTVSHMVILTMPKFKIEYNVNGLPDHLKELGVAKIFQPGVCDLGNLFTQGHRPAYVSTVIQKAVIEVNEQGTEATAATAIVGMVGSAPMLMDLPPEVEVTIDRPFCFWIVSNYMVSFAGVCVDP